MYSTRYQRWKEWSSKLNEKKNKTRTINWNEDIHFQEQFYFKQTFVCTFPKYCCHNVWTISNYEKKRLIYNVFKNTLLTLNIILIT